MGESDKHSCKLCGHETYEIYAYPHGIPEIIPFMAYKEKSWCEGKWLNTELRICPKCGHIQGEVLESGER